MTLNETRLSVAMAPRARRAIAAILLSVVTLWRPVSTAAQGAVFRSHVDLVALTVSVTDAQGQSVAGLTADNFAVFENGVPQSVALFGSSDVALDIGLVIDTSSSMGGALPVIKTAALGLLGTLRPGDRAIIVDVKRSIRIAEPLTDDLTKVTAGVNALAARGETAIYDGVYMSLQEFARQRVLLPEIRRQALVVLSDGLDTASHVTFDAVTELARTLDVTIYTIAARSAAPLSKSEVQSAARATWEMRSLASETGGLSFLPTNATDLPKIYGTIARELAQQYALAYVSSVSAPADAFRRVAIKLLRPVEGTARTRAGYTAQRVGAARAGAPSGAGR